MDRTTNISLAGHDRPYRLDDAAYGRLSRYLDEASSRLVGDPDRSEILADLERSLGDRLATLLGPADRLLVAADIASVIEQIGSVDTGHQAPASGPSEPSAPQRKRRLRRIRTGQQIAGVCAGLADYAELDVSWVRVGFLFATILTAGLFALVYIGLAFILPVSATREA